MKYDFDKEIDRKQTLSIKWNESAIRRIAGTPEAKPFWVADMDFQVAPQIREEAEEIAKQGVYGYPFFDQGREIFCAWTKRRHGWQVATEDVCICQGMLGSIAMLIELMTDKGDEVILPMPAYRPFILAVKNLERKLVEWPMAYDDVSHRFSLDWEALDRLCETAKLIVFCSPHNPSGTSFTEEELVHLCECAANHGTSIVCDEIHSDLSFVPHQPLLPIAERAGCRAVTCMAPSKTFNIAGEHYSVAVIKDKELKRKLERREEQLFMTHTSYFSTVIANSAYENGYDWLMQLLPYLQDSIAYIETYFENHIPELTLIRPQASFIGLIDCGPIMKLVEADAKAHPALYDPSISPNGGLLSRFFGIRAKIAVNDGTWFGGDAYRQFVRFNYGIRRQAIEDAMERLEQALSYLKETYAP